MSAEESTTIDRRAFVTRFMSENDLSYAQACHVYETMCRMFEDGIVTGSKIRLGKVGAIVPVWKPGREINMHFKVGKNRNIQKGIHRTFYVDGRYTFKFNLYEQFVRTHSLKWYSEMPDI